MNNIGLMKASAGTGKTYNLMEELSKFMKDGLQPEKLLAVTFTNAAAAELKSRIRQKLLDDGRADLAQRVFDALIGTVNGVCGQLLAEYAIEAGMSPVQNVIAEEDASAIFQKAVDCALDKYNDAEFFALAARLNMNPTAGEKNRSYGGARDWQDDVRVVHNLARANGMDKDALLKCAEENIAALKEVFPGTQAFSFDGVRKKLQDEFLSLPEECTRNKGTEKVVEKIKSFCRSPYASWRELLEVLRMRGTSTDAKNGFPNEILEDLQDKLYSSKELFEDLSTMIRKVFACAADALETYTQYKKNFGLIDYVDQERNVLDLLNSSPAFRTMLSERLEKVMVDEFQDTSPIQLALFIKLNECSKNGSIWVGDPKQSIYGFRGTDPELMASAVSAIPNPRTLHESWRSKENLVRLANEMFSRTFDLPEDEVVLQIPDARKSEAAGGKISAWILDESNQTLRMQALAKEIADLIRKKNIPPCKIGVLLRNRESNGTRQLVSELQKWNIAASEAGSNRLSETEEYNLVMTAYRIAVNPQDSAAKAVLLALLDEKNDYFARVYQAKCDFDALDDAAKKGKSFIDSLDKNAIFSKLAKTDDATPLEVLDKVISVLELDRRLGAMDFPEKRMRNVQELRKHCFAYMNNARTMHTSATPAGFIAYLASADLLQAKGGSGNNTVNVTTYHSAKGLEWPIVILASLDSDKTGSVFGSPRVLGNALFDFNDPLAGRSIHYWPYPFGKFDSGLDLSSLERQKKFVYLDKEESKRLFYVGLTRARDEVIFAVDLNKKGEMAKAWLDNLSDANIFQLSGGNISETSEISNGKLTVGTAEFPLTEYKWLKAEQDITPLDSLPCFIDKQFDFESVEHFPAAIAPSQAEGKAAEAELLYSLGKANAVKCDDGEFRLLGLAFHSFIALNVKENELETAQKILKNYHVDHCMSAKDMVESTKRFYRYINETWSNAEINCELPMRYVDENGTAYQGFIDMLLETPDGYIIIDHKTHPRQDDAAEYCANCAPQLKLYQKAVEEATGKKVIKLIIHLPNLGCCYRIILS